MSAFAGQAIETYAMRRARLEAETAAVDLERARLERDAAGLERDANVVDLERAKAERDLAVETLGKSRRRLLLPGVSSEDPSSSAPANEPPIYLSPEPEPRPARVPKYRYWARFDLSVLRSTRLAKRPDFPYWRRLYRDDEGRIAGVYVYAAIDAASPTDALAQVQRCWPSAESLVWCRRRSDGWLPPKKDFPQS